MTPSWQKACLCPYAQNDAGGLEHGNRLGAFLEFQTVEAFVGDDGGDSSAARQLDRHLAVNRALLAADHVASQLVAGTQLQRRGPSHDHDRRRLDQRVDLDAVVDTQIFQALGGDQGIDLVAAADIDANIGVDLADAEDGRLTLELVSGADLHCRSPRR